MSFTTWHRRHRSYSQGPHGPFSARLNSWISMVIIIMLACVGLAACGNSGSTNSDGSVNLTYALWDQNEQIGYQQSIDQFMKLHPKIHVTIEETPWASYWQKLSTEFAAGNAPDVFWDHLAYYPQFVQQEQLLNLSPLIAQSHIDMSQYYPALIKEWSYQGKVYGLPKDWDTIAILYNKQMFQQAGLPAPTSMTWNTTDGGTFLQDAQQLTLDQNGKHPTDADFDASHTKQYGFVSENNSQEGYWNFIAMNGGSLLDKQFGQNFQFNQPPARQALQYLVDLVNKYNVSPSATETNNNGAVAEQLFEGGHVAMIAAGDWELSALAQQTKIPWGVVELPAGINGVQSVFNGLTDGIYVNTQHPKEAWELEQWLGSAASESILGAGGYVWPAIKSEDQTFVDAWKKKGIDVSPFLKEAQGTTLTFPITFGYNEGSINVTSIFNQMYLGQIGVGDAADQAVLQANQAAQSAIIGN